MRKVYCRNCRYGKYLCEVRLRKSLENKYLIPQRVGMAGAGSVIYLLNEFNNCYAYKRKWYKFWVKGGMR